MKPYLKTKDYSVSGEEFELMHDQDLDMLVTQPQPGDLDTYYQSEAYISHTDADKTFLDKIYQTIKKRNLVKKLRLAEQFARTNKTLLDVGAGTGDFLWVAKQKGWSTAGVEPNSTAKQRASKKGVALFADLESLPEEKYEVITLWHVLEHLPDLDGQIKKLRSLLTEKGVLIIAVPNFKSYDARYYKNFWAAYDVPRHLWHFSRSSVRKIFDKHGMKPIKIKPMIFDAFYVSLLSEKYKTGKQNFLKAFFIGLKSNLSAWNSKEYSSLIYIIEKN